MNFCSLCPLCSILIAVFDQPAKFLEKVFRNRKHRKKTFLPAALAFQPSPSHRQNRFAMLAWHYSYTLNYITTDKILYYRKVL
jgi:hypothetical protein